MFLRVASCKHCHRCGEAIRNVDHSPNGKLLVFHIYVTLPIGVSHGIFVFLALMFRLNQSVEYHEKSWSPEIFIQNEYVSENVVYPFYPMVLLIIIPFLNGYFIGKINPIFRQTQMKMGQGWVNLTHYSLHSLLADLTDLKPSCGAVL